MVCRNAVSIWSVVGEGVGVHFRDMSVKYYNHQTSTIEKELALELVRPTNKRMPKGLHIYDDDVKVKLEKAGLLQLFEFPYFGKPERLY